MCVLYRSGKEERPWPISGTKINNQSINQPIWYNMIVICKLVEATNLAYGWVVGCNAL